MELDGFKKSCLQLQIHSMGLCWQIRRQRDGLNSKIKYKRWLEWQTIIQRNLQLVKYAYQQTRGNFLIIGTGGIFSSEDAIKMLRNGASLLQIYSSLVIEGPGLTKKMNKEIAHYLTRHGYANVSDIIGLDA